MPLSGVDRMALAFFLSLMSLGLRLFRLGNRLTKE